MRHVRTCGIQGADLCRAAFSGAIPGSLCPALFKAQLTGPAAAAFLAFESGQHILDRRSVAELLDEVLNRQGGLMAAIPAGYHQGLAGNRGE